jgi:hypothetical protein
MSMYEELQELKVLLREAKHGIIQKRHRRVERFLVNEFPRPIRSPEIN